MIFERNSARRFQKTGKSFLFENFLAVSENRGSRRADYLATEAENGVERKGRAGDSAYNGKKCRFQNTFQCIKEKVFKKDRKVFFLKTFRPFQKTVVVRSPHSA